MLLPLISIALYIALAIAVGKLLAYASRNDSIEVGAQGAAESTAPPQTREGPGMPTPTADTACRNAERPAEAVRRP